MSLLSEKYYDSSTESRVTGVVSGPVRSARGSVGTASVSVLSGGGPLEVIIAPDWFISKQAIKLEINQTIEVLGSFIRHGGSVCLLAREIWFGNRKFFIRDPFGKPLWKLCPDVAAEER